MTLLKIARMGHPVLTSRAAEILDPTAKDIRHLINDMVETMNDASGVGLAGPQIYQSRRVIIFKAPPERADDRPGEADPDEAVAPLTALINPEFEPLDDKVSLGIEGCLSIPGLSGVVPRHERIRYRGVSTDGAVIERIASGFHARVVQHEIDHLDGVLFPMRMTDLSLLAFNEEMSGMLAAQASAAEAAADSVEGGEPDS